MAFIDPIKLLTARYNLHQADILTNHRGDQKVT